MLARPTPAEYTAFYAAYVASVPPGNLVHLLEKQADEAQALLDSVPEEQETFRYAPEKWSIREVVAHMTDAERVFAYRAFCISRGEETPLPGFDERAYIAGSSASGRALAGLLHEFIQVRGATAALYAFLPAEGWQRMGVANGDKVSVRALACITLGHAAHHLRVLRQRYGLSL